MCAELAGDFHLGDSRQLTDKSLLTYEVVHDYKSTASQLYSPAPRSDLEINIDLDTHNVLYD